LHSTQFDVASCIAAAERIDEQIVSHHNKKVMIEKKRARREANKASLKKAKTKGVKYFQTTNRGNHGN
jgi:ethanolamine utilization protein EutQ (cupin superfamily)